MLTIIAIANVISDSNFIRRICILGQDCPDGVPVTFVKYSNSAPRSVLQPILLYASTPGVAITAECYNRYTITTNKSPRVVPTVYPNIVPCRCRKSVDCAGFIVDYTSTSCYRVPNMGSLTDNIIVSPNVNFFRKACIRGQYTNLRSRRFRIRILETSAFLVPESCNRRAWPIEVSMDYELAGFQYSVIPNVGDKWRCTQLCIDDNHCKSANYFRKTKMCSLNSETQRTRPTAFNPSQNLVEYIENECADTEPGATFYQSYRIIFVVNTLRITKRY